MELDEVDALLADRIEREEFSLYAMYLPPDAFGNTLPDGSTPSLETPQASDEPAQSEVA